METMRLCSNCGTTLAPDAPRGLCPECLLKAGLASQTDTGIPTSIAAEPEQPRRDLPQPGQLFGGYRIVREVGHGGMGAVFEAEQLESGRRVALKVLSHKLDSTEARKRFLREGRLAAQINHPNSVYVYGTEEIEGTPAIAMELIAGGTLQQSVEQHGPLTIAQAVDAILQLIAGLEAAQALGILHRDIKPSNCFTDADGTVKIGDFGLSISTATRAETSLTLHGSFLGTPVFSSPEQLRGDELNARSDMYSVGVTLFYLLTARTPFEGRNMVQLLANVLEQPAPSPRKFRPGLPPNLARAILRCLEKQPGERFKSYDELRQALAPFSSAAPVPANPGLRFAAGVLDMFFLSSVGLLTQLLVKGNPFPFLDVADSGPYLSSKMLPLVLGSFVVMSLYYALLEGLWGASVGKAVCRLRLVGPDRNPPGVPKALVRALVFVLLPPLPYWIAFGFSPNAILAISTSPAGFGLSLAYYVLLALLFVTMRSRNGFAAVHDLLTGTRVIRKSAHQARPVLPATAEPPPAIETLPKVGPYHVLAPLEASAPGEWLLGYDLRLLRKVWIRVLPPGTPPLLQHLRNLGRVGRLRWIGGRRSPDENWDAFEGVTGRPLLHLASQRQPWSQVRFWLFDLAAEISAAEKDGTLPAVLTLDRVWITADGRAKLLDFPAPGVAPTPRPPQIGDSPDRPPLCDWRPKADSFLGQVACAALEGRTEAATRTAPDTPRVPLPFHARSFFERLSVFPDAGAIVAALQPLLAQPAAVSRLRRLGVIGGCLAFPAVATVGMLVGFSFMNTFERRQPELARLSELLQQRQGVRMMARMSRDKRDPAPTERALAIYIAGHFRQAITNTDQWTSLFAVSMINGESRRFAEESLAKHPNPTDQEISEATQVLKPYLETSRAQKTGFLREPWFLPIVGGVCLVIYVAVPAVLAALLFRGGLLLRIFGLAVARTDGRRASRLRVFWRSLIAWSPVLLAPVLIAVLVSVLGPYGGGALVVALVAGLVGWSLALPGRGLQDRLAGTWLVPR
jgi:eukaryotic-like serine/threonine-protein kinase